MLDLLTYCGYEGGVEGVLAEAEQQTRLSDSAIPDEQQLEQIIVRFRHFFVPNEIRFHINGRLSRAEPSRAGIPPPSCLETSQLSAD